MSWKNFKKEFFYLAKAFFEYKNGFRYLKNKFFVAPKILKSGKVLERPVNQKDLSIHVLTGKRDLLLFIWAMASYYLVANKIGYLYVHSDGTLNGEDIKTINKFFPGAKVIKPEEFLNEYKSVLNEYPIIKNFRTDYPRLFLLKKIVDPYFSSPKPQRLILDSDLLWFKNPEEIERQIGNGASFMMSGFAAGAGNQVYFKDGGKLDDNLANFNSGIVLYKKENFNLDKFLGYLENFDLEKSANRHFIEQAAYAYCLENLSGLPAEKYQIKGGLTGQTVVKHYTAPRRIMFYVEGVEKLKSQFL